MRNKNIKEIKKGCPEAFSLRLSRLLGCCRFITITNNPKKGCPELQPFRTTTLLNVKAFTLIELLVVVLIIGILAAIALPQYEKAVMRSRFATLKAAADALYQAEKIYFMANGTYTADMTALDVIPSGCTLNDQKDICSYPWGNCRILNSTDTKRVSCENTQSLQNGYAHYFYGRYPETACWAFSDNKTDKYNQLCKLEGGRFFDTAKCTKNKCQIYRM